MVATNCKTSLVLIHEQNKHIPQEFFEKKNNGKKGQEKGRRKKKKMENHSDVKE